MITYKFKSIEEIAVYFAIKAQEARHRAEHSTKGRKEVAVEFATASALEFAANVLRNTVIE